MVAPDGVGASAVTRPPMLNGPAHVQVSVPVVVSAIAWRSSRAWANASSTFSEEKL